ncbi:hypothetical protein [Demequina iriomotensis]|uniref:hypothetical protein n=1 Tax=Demequina iriomotensis TaxID=1536641 RepID=UPI0007854828|nr:hypothetical protein [Demequina iriomotensis]
MRECERSLTGDALAQASGPGRGRGAPIPAPPTPSSPDAAFAVLDQFRVWFSERDQAWIAASDVAATAWTAPTATDALAGPVAGLDDTRAAEARFRVGLARARLRYDPEDPITIAEVLGAFEYGPGPSTGLDGPAVLFFMSSALDDEALAAVAAARSAADSGQRHTLDEVLEELGIDIEDRGEPEGEAP